MEQNEKSLLRKEVRARKKQFTEKELIAQSEPLIKRVLSHPRLQDAKTVLLYNSLADEVYTHDLIQQLHQEGKRVLLPVVMSDTEMELRLYKGQDFFKSSSFGILEPIGEPFTDFSSIEFVLIPGMAFDSQKNRLGRGKGYYDRFLPLLIKWVSVFLSSSCQLFQQSQLTKGLMSVSIRFYERTKRLCGLNP